MTQTDSPPIDMDAEPTLADLQAADPAISSHSRWSDDTWRLDGENGGQSGRTFAIGWKVAAPAQLVDEAKMLAALLFLERDGDRVLKHTTAGTFSAGMRHLLRFMTLYSYFSFEDLDEDAFSLFRDNLAVKLSDPEWFDEEFGDQLEDAGPDATGASEDGAVEDLPDESDFESVEEPEVSKPDPIASTKGETDPLTRAAAYYRLRTWRQLREAAPAMRKAGCRAMDYNPFATKSLTERTHEASSVASFLIPPLPDRVALRIMETAQGLLGAPADDVIELQRRYCGKLLRLDRQRTTAERQKLRELMEGFEFAKVGGSPWHPPIRLPADRPGGGIEMKQLIALIRDAAVLVILCGTGVRISELCSIVADPTVPKAELPLFDDGPPTVPALPFCVTSERSKTGMNEHLFMRSRLFKNERTPRDERWLIGARPMGSDVEPPVLRALRVLEALYQPWRTLAGDERTRSHLILGLLGSGLPVSPKSVAPIQAGPLRFSLRGFIRSRCHLEDLEPFIDEDRRLRPYVEKRGDCIHPHQWRKTFALYMMKVDDRMVPALAHHFKHMSIAVTENSYMPSDASMLAAGESVHAQEAARWFYEQRHAAGGSFGRLDEIMREHREEWEKLVADLPFEEALPQVARFVVEKDIRIFHAEHGRCVIGANPDQARCHQVAGTSSWRNTQPNYAQRTPGQCTGCSNYSVSAEHAGFWRKRYISHHESWLRSDRSPQFRVVQKRAQQAAAILKALGVTLPVILVEAPSDRTARKKGASARQNPPTQSDQGEAA